MCIIHVSFAFFSFYCSSMGILLSVLHVMFLIFLLYVTLTSSATQIRCLQILCGNIWIHQKSHLTAAEHAWTSNYPPDWTKITVQANFSDLHTRLTSKSISVQSWKTLEQGQWLRDRDITTVALCTGSKPVFQNFFYLAFSILFTCGLCVYIPDLYITLS